MPFWREAFGISLASASLAVTVMNGVQIVTMFTLGRAIDIHGERRIVGIAMLGMALAMAGAASFANSLPALLLCIAFLGGTYAAVQPGGTRAIMRWFPPAKRGIATGFRQAAVPFGTMIAAALLPFMAVRYGWHAAAWLCAGVSVMGAALFWGLYREGGDVTAKTERPLPLARLAREVGQNPSFWPVLRLGIAMSAFQFTLTAHVIGFMADGLGLGLLPHRPCLPQRSLQAFLAGFCCHGSATVSDPAFARNPSAWYPSLPQALPQSSRLCPSAFRHLLSSSCLSCWEYSGSGGFHFIFCRSPKAHRKVR
ncbi:MFS transporter [Agrobacterium sp. LMR679]|nr:MFS transporter [Agrobacterium sp. LMR679]MCZ4071973.1 MFS transporter [Agrobacterium sp. LMR679]